MVRLIYAKRVKKDFQKLTPVVQRRIITKLEFYSKQPDPDKFAESLFNHPLGSFRFRIGDYRVICELHGDALLVSAVGHRREIYK